MARLLLNCVEDEAKLKAFVERELGLEVLLARGDLATRAAIKSDSISLVLRHSGESVVRDLAFARELRDWGYQKPIVTLTDGAGDGLISAPGVCFVERPHDPDVLKGIAKKMLAAEVVPQQVFRRYLTNLSVRIETYDAGAPLETKMFNLSRGGAYCELGRKPSVRVGDLLKLRVWLSEFEREHTLSGRVVWITARGRQAGGYGLGLKFMNYSDMYRRLQP